MKIWRSLIRKLRGSFNPHHRLGLHLLFHLVKNWHRLHAAILWQFLVEGSSTALDEIKNGSEMNNEIPRGDILVQSLFWMNLLHQPKMWQSLLQIPSGWGLERAWGITSLLLVVISFQNRFMLAVLPFMIYLNDCLCDFALFSLHDSPEWLFLWFMLFTCIRNTDFHPCYTWLTIYAICSLY